MRGKIILAAVLVSIVGFVGVKEVYNTAPKTNVILIVADDMGYGDLSCYGAEKGLTPNIDAFAEKGVKYTNFYAPTPYCAPARASILTGKHPLHHGLLENPAPDAGIDEPGLDPSEVTLAERLGAIGYQSAIIGKWHLGHQPKFFPRQQGFDHYYGILYSNDMRPVQIWENEQVVKPTVDQRYITEDYTNQAIDFIDKNKDNPFFLYLTHAMPHKPLAASEKFYTPDTPDDLYQDVIRELDYNVGRLLDHLKATGLDKNTVVVFMSDNGPWFGGSTGSLKGMKATNWEGGIRIPFIIQYPGAPEGVTIDQPAWIPDIVPTMAEFTGFDLKKENLDGRSILGQINGKDTDERLIVSIHRDQPITIRKGKWKLFVNEPTNFHLPDDWVDPRAPDGTTIIAQTEQATVREYPGIRPDNQFKKGALFNLSLDAGEQKDVAAQHPEIVSALTKELNQFLNGQQP
ncbi:sulfatase-like hydrolase/transferase [Persicobacter psychrovividus]|uniref:Arylsulfatase n=1 Tax=Persicobacter psychrovividus TaxID=387638 RepID=A0ABN6LFS0_9BACT|nr:arylsulfatase [Persicobacter psychrovividus]